jgi:phage gp36-like protein
MSVYLPLSLSPHSLLSCASFPSPFYRPVHLRGIMLAYLTYSDFDLIIQEEDLLAVSGDNPVLLEGAEKQAMEEAASYLRHRYDMPAAFALTGDARNPRLTAVIVDIALYHLHSRLSPHNVPDLRIRRYEDAIEWLHGVSKGLITSLLPTIEPEQGKVFEWGSHLKHNHYL